eukprot:Sspe_Gene.7664::Locus_2592_Transcript_3_4_Confidence_0.333_Length_1392::g.7664::m.7664
MCRTMHVLVLAAVVVGVAVAQDTRTVTKTLQSTTMTMTEYGMITRTRTMSATLPSATVTITLPSTTKIVPPTPTPTGTTTVSTTMTLPSATATATARVPSTTKLVNVPTPTATAKQVVEAPQEGTPEDAAPTDSTSPAEACFKKDVTESDEALQKSIEEALGLKAGELTDFKREVTDSCVIISFTIPDSKKKQFDMCVNNTEDSTAMCQGLRNVGLMGAANRDRGSSDDDDGFPMYGIIIIVLTSVAFIVGIVFFLRSRSGPRMSLAEQIEELENYEEYKEMNRSKGRGEALE